MNGHITNRDLYSEYKRKHFKSSLSLMDLINAYYDTIINYSVVSNSPIYIYNHVIELKVIREYIMKTLFNTEDMQELTLYVIHTSKLQPMLNRIKCFNIDINKLDIRLSQLSIPNTDKYIIFNMSDMCEASYIKTPYFSFLIETLKDEIIIFIVLYLLVYEPNRIHF